MEEEGIAKAIIAAEINNELASQADRRGMAEESRKTFLKHIIIKIMTNTTRILAFRNIFACARADKCYGIVPTISWRRMKVFGF